MGNKKYSLIKGTNVEIDSSNITGKLIKVNGILNQKTREQVNGTTVKSENINVNDVTIETGRLDFFGNLQQETREGYNFLPITLTSQTINGVTITVNYDKSITFNGTASAYFVINLFEGSQILPIGNYNYSLGNKNTGINFIGVENGIEVVYLASSVSNTYRNITLTEEKTLTLVKIAVSNGTVFNNFTIYPMIYKGTETKEYEQYGVSPSSDYPSQIRVVGDNVNLFDKNNTIKLNTSISGTGLGLEDSNLRTLIFPCKFNKTYTVSKIKSSRFSMVTLVSYGYNNTSKISAVTNNDATSLTITTNDKANYLAVYYYNASADTITEQEILDSIKIEESTVATDYTSYGNGGIGYKAINKNFLDSKYFLAKTASGMTGSVNEDGSIRFNGTSTALINFWYSYMNVVLKAGTYTFSSNVDIVGKGRYTLIDGTSGTNVTIANQGKTNTFTLAKDVTLTNLLIQINSGVTFDNQDFYIQLEKNDTQTEYEKHDEKNTTIELPEGEFLAKLGNYEDSIDNSGLLKKWISKKVLNGTENIVYTANSGTRYAYRLDISDRMLGDNHYVCTHFKQKSNGAWDSDGIISVNKTDTLIYIFVSNISTVDDFKAWLAEQYAAGTPVEIYYVLKNYSTVELSETSQIRMNYLAKLPMYLPITNVYSEDTISPFFRLRYNYVPALPNPDEFSPISVVGDNINLFDITNRIYTSIAPNTVNVTLKDNLLTASSSSNSAHSSYLISNLKIGQTYIVNWENAKNFNSIQLSSCDSNGTAITQIFRNYNTTASVKFEATTEYAQLNILSSDSPPLTIENIKIEQGTIATGYTSYGNGGFDYKAIGKNLFNFKAFFENCLTTRCTKTLLENGIKIDFTAGADAWIGNAIGANIPIHPYEKAGCIKVKPNTRYVMQMSSAPKCFISFLDKNHVGVRGFVQIPSTYNKSTYTFDTTNDTEYLYFRFGITDSNYTSYSFTDIQLAQEMTVSDYEPYKEQISTIELPNGEFMAKIGDVQDYIDNTGVLHKYIKKVVYDGTEIWSANMNSGWSQNKHVFGLNNKEVETKYGNATNAGNVLMSTHYITTNTSSLVFSETNCIAYYPANGKIVINHRNINNVTDFKAWLAEQYAAGTPVEVYYITNEPYTVDLSDEDYAKIQSVPMLIDYNNISLEPENNEFVLVYEGDEIEKSYDVTITDSGKLQPFGLTIDYNKTNLPLIAEADEASQIITGADGDVVLNTTYGPRMFEITAVTDDYLTAEEKEAKREEIREFLNAIKNKTAKLIIEPLNRTFEVKYSGVAEDNNLPKCVEFVIPLKSSNSYAISNETYSHIGSGDFDSNTVEPAGCKITITGPANVPNININGYDVIWNHILAEGQKLIIDSKKSTVTRVSSLGVKTNVMAYYSHQFPKIQKGVNFVEIISGIEDSQLKIEWNDLLL